MLHFHFLAADMLIVRVVDERVYYYIHSYIESRFGLDEKELFKQW